MNASRQNFYPSYKIRMNVDAVAPGTSLPAIITEISPDKICFQSKKAIPPNSRIALSLKLKKRFVLHGNVLWVLDLYTRDGYHYFQTGIKTDSIIHANTKAIGLAEKSRLLQDVLLQKIDRNPN